MQEATVWKRLSGKGIEFKRYHTKGCQIECKNADQ